MSASSHRRALLALVLAAGALSAAGPAAALAPSAS
jgi:hypothetical protein